jgi:hypothetical protein
MVKTKRTDINQSANNRLDLNVGSSAALCDKKYWRARLAGGFSSPSTRKRQFLAMIPIHDLQVKASFVK